MAFSLGKPLKAVRESLGLTQEQVIEPGSIHSDITMSQQTLSQHSPNFPSIPLSTQLSSVNRII
jgi:hypothetical protein